MRRTPARRRAGGCACTRRRCAGRPIVARAKQRERRRRRARRPVLVVDAMPAARRVRRCSRSSWPGLRRRAGGRGRSFHCTWHALPDPARAARRSTRLDFDAAIEMDGAVAEAVVAKRLERQRAERRPFLGKHRGDLALRGAVDARVGPVRFPAIEIRLRRLERLEAQALQRRLLRVADAGFDFPFAIGIADATRQRDDAVVREHVAIERIERGIVDVRREHALRRDCRGR